MHTECKRLSSLEVVATSPSIGALMRSDGVLRIVVGTFFLVRHFSGSRAAVEVHPVERNRQQSSSDNVADQCTDEIQPDVFANTGTSAKHHTPRKMIMSVPASQINMKSTHIGMVNMSATTCSN